MNTRKTPAKMSDMPRREPVTDADLIRLLCEIRRLALSKYPFIEGDRVDPVLCQRLGEIAGMCGKTIEVYRARETSDARR